MPITIEHELGDWELGVEIAKDPDAAGVVLTAMCVSLLGKSNFVVNEFAASLNYQAQKVAPHKDAGTRRVIAKLALALIEETK